MNQYCITAYTKKELYDLIPNEWESRVIIAQDHYKKKQDTITKKYFWFKSHRHFVSYMESVKERWFYEVFEDQQANCMYFDIEWYFDCAGFKLLFCLLKSLEENTSE